MEEVGELKGQVVDKAGEVERLSVKVEEERRKARLERGGEGSVLKSALISWRTS